MGIALLIGCDYGEEVTELLGKEFSERKGVPEGTSGTHTKHGAMKSKLADLPGVTGAEEFVQVAGPALGDYVLDLLI